MKVLILGATGRTGKLLLHQALERGLEVRAIVRDKTKVNATSEQLELIEGDVFDGALLNEALMGCEAVLSCLNISRTSDFPWAPLRTPEDFLSRMMEALVAAMDRQGVQRVIITSAWGVGDSRVEIPWWFRWVIDHSNVGKAYAQHELQERLLRESKMDYTCVRPVGLTNANKLKTLVVSKAKSPKPGLLISRRHTAKFMLDSLEEGTYVKDLPVISEK